MAVIAALRGVLEFVIVGAVNVKTVTRHGGFLSKNKASQGDAAEL